MSGASASTRDQVRADIGRWKREIQQWRKAGLADDHPNIARRLARIEVASRFLEADADQELGDTATRKG